MAMTKVVCEHSPLSSAPPPPAQPSLTPLPPPAVAASTLASLHMFSPNQSTSATPNTTPGNSAHGCQHFAALQHANLGGVSTPGNSAHGLQHFASLGLTQGLAAHGLAGSGSTTPGNSSHGVPHFANPHELSPTMMPSAAHAIISPTVAPCMAQASTWPMCAEGRPLVAAQGASLGACPPQFAAPHGCIPAQYAGYAPMQPMPQHMQQMAPMVPMATAQPIMPPQGQVPPQVASAQANAQVFPHDGRVL